MAHKGQDLWLRRFHASEGAVCEVVCFPHAGGAASSWRGLSAELSPTVDVLAVQYPGRQDRHREAPVGDLHRLADLIAGVLGPGRERPRALLGHSMGASLAYEVAVRLAREPGGEPRLLVLSGRRAPSLPPRDRSWLRDDAALIAKVRALGGTDAALLDDPELRELVLPALRGDYRALASYQGTPGRTLSCPVLALAGGQDTDATAADVEAWRHHTSGDFRMRVFEGGHFFLSHHTREAAGLVRELLPTHVG
ncbi:thioesterase II family protein [Streptomyces sp. NPDC057877]|uniref:thioesterase II family protein n=1 Tax=Streptomyces sp. NPDC057877 TaxID=3346269 RepID=UPI003678F266